MATIDRGGLRVRYRDPAGRNRSETFTRKSDARARRAQIEADLARRKWVDPRLAETPFETFAWTWFSSLSHLRPGARLNIEGRLKNHIIPAFGKTPIAAIQPSDVRSWVSGLLEKGLTQETSRTIYRNLNQIFRTAEVDGLLTRSPCVGIKWPRQTARKEMRFLDPLQLSRLASAIKPRYSALIFTAGYTGLRWGELATLKVGRVNLASGTVDVVESLTEVKGLNVGPPKNGRTRSVPISPFLVEMLREQMFNFPSPHGYLFSSSEGGPLRRNNFYKRDYKPAVLKSGLDPDLRFHDLRHSCAALLIAQGAHPKEIQEHLGHSSIRTTLDRYGHLFPSLSERLKLGLEAAFRRTE